MIDLGSADWPRLPEPAGGYDGDWLYEDDGLNRAGIRVQRELHRERSEFQELAVYETPFHGRVLTLDGLVMFSERDEFVYHEMLVHVPLCAVTEATNVLIIGGGDCGCLREVLRHPGVARVVQCDIDERVTEVSRDHFSWVAGAMADPRAELVFDDGIRYVAETRETFDLVVIDSTDPMGPAVGLFQEPFYRNVSRVLKPGGIMTAQAEAPNWAAGLMGRIHAEQRKVFRQVHGYFGMIPTYPSGSWSWSFATDRSAADVTAIQDMERAVELAEHCLYYNPEIHLGAFQLPNFMRRAAQGDNVFERFDRDAAVFVADHG